MTELVIYRGLPASGKTTHARAWVAEDAANRARVNRDDLRLMLHGGYVDRDVERRVRVARDRLTKALLDQGVSVACDDTNLPQQVARDLARLGRFAGADVRVVDLTDVPLEECVSRDFERGYPELAEGHDGYVGKDVIRRMHDRWLAGRPSPLPLPVDARAPDEVVPYEARPGTPRAIMVDLDGTLCLHNGRSPYDETRVGEDLPNAPVVETVRLFRESGYETIFCSGRSEACRPATAAWLREHVDPTRDRSNGNLYMRAAGDARKDAIVKREIFDREIRDRYDVAFVLDDRRQVVDAWRELGLAVFQVAPGDF